MSVFSRTREWFRGEVPPESGVDLTTTPTATQATQLKSSQLREFVYLDEVSLRSLLSSIEGGITEGTSITSSDGVTAGLSGAISANIPVAAKAEVASHFQTKNDNSIETARKATVQSWFSDFHSYSELRVVDTGAKVKIAKDLSELPKPKYRKLRFGSDQLQRGGLVEFRVQLATDPVYHMSALVTEFSGMLEDYPELFGEVAGFGEAEQINKILERLLAGLVPIKAVAVDHSVIQVGDEKFVVHNELIRDLEIETEPLCIVGVTEQAAYWKDLRRVLFSGVEFTLLGRIGRSGIQESWSPVKAAELFESVAPGIVQKINAAGRIPFGASDGTDLPSKADQDLSRALSVYAEAVLQEIGFDLATQDVSQLELEILRVSDRSESVSRQRSAFACVRETIEKLSNERVPDEIDLALREKARSLSGLSYFPALDAKVHSANTAGSGSDPTEPENLLDLEVIAIYW